MANIIRVRINWSGFIGGPGYTNLHWEPVAAGAISQAVVDDAVSVTQTWLAAWRSSMNTTVVTGVDATVTEIDENSGAIQAFWTANPTAPAGGTQSVAYAAGSGACVNLSTDGVRNGRRVRGRIFMVPLAANAYGVDGTLDDTKLTAFRTATATLIGAANLARLTVWVRPFGLPIEINGGAYDVNSFSISDKVAQLRSRRD